MRNKKSKSSLGVLLSFLVVIAGALYVYTSETFEREVPKVTMNNNGFWNLKKPLEISIDDASGLKSYSVILKSSSDERTLYNEQLMVPKQSVKMMVDAPTAYVMKDKEITILIQASDVSKWNFFNGNSTVVEYKLKIDKNRPQLSSLANSYKINKGGAALVIFKANDDNLKEIYIETNFGKKFTVQPFYKEGHYISLLAWPVTEENFKATIIAKDYAENVSTAYIPLYLKDNKYRVSNIALDDKFLKGKIAELAQEFEETQGVDDSIEQFKIINEKIRAKNEDLIHEITSKVSTQMINDFKINKMYPLENGAVVAHFGDHRFYSYDGKQISESYHLGLDMASNAMSKIVPKNGGNVVFSEYNGLYGNMPIIDHGLGLYTLYGHCSSVNVRNGDSVEADTYIANTGRSGYAMGDHLHFGVLIQGIEVRPEEWMDDSWMKLNITDVINSAKEIIDRG